MNRDIFTPEHDAFREMVREFIAREVTPHHGQWERDGMVSRDVWLAAGRAACSASTWTRSTAAEAIRTTAST